MQTKTFIDEVVASAELADRDKAEAITLAVIETICIYLPPEQTRRLASQLPKELAKAAEAGAHQALQTEGWVTIEAFYAQVAQRAELPIEEIHVSARAVLREFKQALNRNESIDVVMAAPAGLEALLTE